MNKDTIQIIVSWWHQLHGISQAQEVYQGPNYSADRARLRRCERASDLMLEPAYHRLRRRILEKLPGNDPGPDQERLAIIAMVLAHVKASSPHDFATRCSESPQGEKAALSEARFSKILRARRREEAARLIRRALPQIQGTLNPYELIDALYWWNKDVRNRWASTYYAHLDI